MFITVIHNVYTAMLPWPGVVRRKGFPRNRDRLQTCNTSVHQGAITLPVPYQHLKNALVIQYAVFSPK